VPILPLIDLMILLGSLNLGVSVVIKLIAISTNYNSALFGLGSFDYVVVAIVCFVFALTLAARTWVKLHELQLIIARREAATAQARLRVAGMDGGASEPVAGDPAESNHEATAAERR
jgi:hypothetical protein